MPIAAWLLTLVGPLVKKVLVSLGIGIISYAAISTIIGVIKSMIAAQFGAIAADYAALAGLFGFYDAIGFILAGITTRLSLQPLKRWGILS